MKRVAPLRYDVIFKKAFCEPEIFTAFVQAVLGIRIEINKVETEKSFNPPLAASLHVLTFLLKTPKIG
jgi:hypothetical protein